VQTGVGYVSIQVPKVRNRSGSDIKFNYSLLPPYLKRTKSTYELIPWLFFKWFRLLILVAANIKFKDVE